MTQNSTTFIFSMLKIKVIIEELNTMIIALCDQNYVLNEEYIILGIYLYTDISCLGGIFSKNTSRETKNFPSRMLHKTHN